ncbi:type II toxin-antitoxin system BrnA family antitoxin [Crocosphaera subtropica]|uniref:type II toxin-antitoxin system BrnA family antitoxin n=1 Tax=Crocosphaera subtropica TaxID=2546360 RepID=UPI0002313C22|nr:hypothetical protein [Crocosphaera subtropica]
MKVKTFDEKFDRGEEDIIGHPDLRQAQRIGLSQKRVNVDFPQWMIKSLHREARRLGITQQSLIKVWIAERLEKFLY